MPNRTLVPVTPVRRRRPMLFGAMLPALVLAVVSTASGATVGNVSDWSRNGQDVNFTIADGSRLFLSVLAADLVRVRFAPNGDFGANVSRAVVKDQWEAVPFTVGDSGVMVTLETAQLVVTVQKSPCVVTVRDLDRNLLVGDDPTRRMDWDSTRTRVYKTIRSGEKFLGLGWRTLPLVRNGTRFAMRNVPNYGHTEAFYGGVPLWYGLLDGKAYAIFFNDASWGEINAGAQSSQYLFFQNTGGPLEYYVFYGPRMAKILDRYTELTGRPFLPPKWAAGYQQCRWSYTPQSQVLAIAGEFRSRDIPCDVMYLDIDYMNRGRALTFNPSTFPNPSSMLGSLRQQGFRVIANISPFLFNDDPKFSAAQSGGHFLLKSNGSLLQGWHDYWYFVGGAGTGSLAWLDFTKTSTRNWWKSQHTSFLSQGIDGIWNDLNEPDELGGAWPSDVKYNFDGQSVNHSKTSNQYCLIQTENSYDILRDQYPDRRPFVVSRGAFAGIQRSSAVWSGDNVSDWTNDMKRNIPMGLSMSISGQPHNGHDIGGFFGYPTFNTKPTAELFVRWMQWGVFSAFCRAHHDGWGNFDPGRPFVEPWRFGTEAETICRDFISLRYRLMPYLYSLFYEAHVSGAPIQRPTVYDFPHDPATPAQDYDFLFGPSMLVSPVYVQGAQSRSVYLPAGADWIDWWDDTRRTGGQNVVVNAPLARLPIHVRAGAIIPMGPVMEYADALPITELVLRVYPDDAESAFTLFEDDGLSWAYQSGGHALTTFTSRGRDRQFVFTVSARAGSFQPAPRTLLLEVHNWHETDVPIRVNGQQPPVYTSRAQFDLAGTGVFHDTNAKVLYVRFADTGLATTVRAGAGEGDYDGDSIPDELEAKSPALGQTNRFLADSDGDGLEDGVEDANRNGVRDPGETDARGADSDGDGWEDGIELLLLDTDPLDAGSPSVSLVDADGDRLPATDPGGGQLDWFDNRVDSDDDRFADGYEAACLGVDAVIAPALRPSLGDMNRDGAVSNVDALLVQSFFLGAVDAGDAVFGGSGFMNGDVNRDGFFSNVDALLMQSLFLNVWPHLPGDVR